MSAPDGGYVPLATAEDMTESPYKFMIRDADPGFVDRQMVRASRQVESRCRKRFSPFVGMVQSQIAEGVRMPERGVDDLTGLGAGAVAVGAGLGAITGGGVRDVWLDHHPPHQPELWTFTDVSVVITTEFGGRAAPIVDGLIGPSPDTGHLILPYGTFCPPGSEIVVTYSGGYTRGIPEDLNQAAMLAAAKLLVVQIAPERRGNLSTTDLDKELARTLRPWGATSDNAST